MVLSVNSSSSKAVLGFAVFAAFGIGTVVFLRYRGNAPTQLAAPSLDKGRFSFLAGVPLIGRAYNHFNPTKKAEPVTSLVGSPTAPIRTMDELRQAFSGERQRLAIISHPESSAAPTFQEVASLIIYGDHLDITQDPGILVLRPMKLILVGTRMVEDLSLGSLYHEMLLPIRGWNVDRSSHQPQVVIVEVATIEEALAAKPTINPLTTKPYHTVYSVRA